MFVSYLITTQQYYVNGPLVMFFLLNNPTKVLTLTVLHEAVSKSCA